MHANGCRPALVGRAVGGRDRLNSSDEDRNAKAPAITFVVLVVRCHLAGSILLSHHDPEQATGKRRISRMLVVICHAGTGRKACSLGIVLVLVHRRNGCARRPRELLEMTCRRHQLLWYQAAHYRRLTGGKFDEVVVALLRRDGQWMSNWSQKGGRGG